MTSGSRPGSPTTDPEAYERWFDSPFGHRADRVERRMLRELLAAFQGARSLLDVGCGSGHFVDLWTSSGVVATGLDVDPAMLRHARRRHPGLRAVLGDAHRLPFREGAFDVATLITVLEFLEDPAAALREAARVARRGLVLGVLSSRSPVAWWRRARRSRTYGEARFYSPRALARLVRDALAEREPTLWAATGLHPLPGLDRLPGLPCGAFIGMGVHFREGGSPR